eukprot:4961475-Pyramimonas_sp.AAC.1
MATCKLQRLRRRAGQAAGGTERGRRLATTLAVGMWKGDPAMAFLGDGHRGMGKPVAALPRHSPQSLESMTSYKKGVGQAGAPVMERGWRASRSSAGHITGRGQARADGNELAPSCRRRRRHGGAAGHPLIPRRDLRRRSCFQPLI